MVLSGDLKDFELNDVFQFIQMGGKNGALHIKSNKGVSVIYFKGGNILHAEMGVHEGVDAISVLLNWKVGTFNFIPDEETDKITIDLPVQNVILEAARQVDEWEKMKDVLPSINVVVDFIEEPDAGNIELQPMEWKTLSFIDGNKTVKEIADKLETNSFEVAKILYSLVQSGLIKVVKEKKF
ncbi:DUF4388 domain-containing protein [candidate division WOR-3 bacterium]|nr:DUF4388 domain-containing protein [candidate division WOR-3 bacterium]